MLLNSSNIQTVGCLLLSVIISIFTWYSSRGSNAHSQQQTAFISRQTCVSSPTDSFWGKVFIKLSTQCQAADIDWPGSPEAPLGCQLIPSHPCLDQHTSENGSRHFQPESNYQGTLLSAGASYTKHRMGNMLYSKSGVSESGWKASEHTQ